MKSCPQCRSTYADETLRFCLQDGTPLLDGQAPESESPTVSFDRIPPDSNKTEELTRISRTPQYTTNKDASQLRVEIPPTRPEFRPGSDTVSNPQSGPAPSGNRTLVAVLGTVIVMLVVFGAGLGAWSFLQTRNEGAQTTGQANTRTENAPARKSSPEKREISQKNTAIESNDAANKPAPDLDDVKKEVARQVDSWKSFAEARDLDSYMAVYADRIDYYNKKGASISFVRGDKLKAFTKYDSIAITLSNVNISADDNGEQATAVFDKAWLFQNQVKSSEGKVQTQLRLVKIGGVWKISGERDLKVYYVK